MNTPSHSCKLRHLLTVIPLCILIMMTGCETVQGPSESAFKPTYPTRPTLGLAVIDTRPYVLSGDKQPAFEYIMRMYGVPVSHNTYKSQAMSEWLGLRLKAGLEQSGSRVNYRRTFAGDSVSRIVTELNRRENDCVLVFLLRDVRWDIPDLGNTRARFTVECLVFNSHSEEVSTGRVHFDEALFQAFTMNIYKAFLEQYRTWFQQLFMQDSIRDFLMRDGRGDLSVRGPFKPVEDTPVATLPGLQPIPQDPELYLYRFDKVKKDYEITLARLNADRIIPLTALPEPDIQILRGPTKFVLKHDNSQPFDSIMIAISCDGQEFFLHERDRPFAPGSLTFTPGDFESIFSGTFDGSFDALKVIEIWVPSYCSIVWKAP